MASAMMLFEAFLGLIDAGILKREIDGVILHGAFFLGAEIILSRAARDGAGTAGAHPDDAGIVHQRALTATKMQNEAPGSTRGFVNNVIVATLMGAAIFRRAGRWPGCERGRRPV